MQVSPNGIALTKKFESCRLTAYPDPGTGAEPWTCGWGSTGPDITQGTVWTQAQADSRLEEGLNRAGQAVNGLVHVVVNQNQFDSLCDFVYNVGAGNFRSSTLLRLLNAGDFAGAAQQFARWNLAAGHVLPGLVARRAAEQALFNTPV
ncbi:lysozyme [Paraburkholderia phenazinium]|uniref:Lysozyme n=1 Tax=Paraburkholderia phenazinium TaxID=60549 RepID=A0A1G7ZJB8_9BURK|nr:lysozyme [Paraburkholderia phenazinium]SDH08832.1 lysozyme [Paraburkholderia phenazinium]